MRPVFLVAAIAACVVAGCASQPALIQLEPARNVTVTYEGHIGDTGKTFEVPEFDAEPVADKLIRLEAYVITAPAELVADALVYAAIPRALSLTPEQAAELSARLATNPPEGAQVALRAPAAETEPAPQEKKDPWAKFRREAAKAMSAPVVTAYSGQRCTLEISNEVAFISGFEINSQGGQWIADPVVRTVRTGIQLGVLPRLREGGDVEIDMQIVVSQPVLPMAQREVQLMGAPMTVQSPTLITQKLSAAGIMQKDRLLLLTGLLGQGDKVLLVFVTAGEAKLSDDVPAPKKD